VLVVVLIPTTEKVFETFVSDLGVGVTSELQRLYDSERQAYQLLGSHLEEHGIRYVDTLPALERSLGAGSNPFPGDWNGHLNAVGNRVVAEAILESGILAEPSLGVDGS
jgi:hypothetical protein